MHLYYLLSGSIYYWQIMLGYLLHSYALLHGLAGYASLVKIPQIHDLVGMHPQHLLNLSTAHPLPTVYLAQPTDNPLQLWAVRPPAPLLIPKLQPIQLL